MPLARAKRFRHRRAVGRLDTSRLYSLADLSGAGVWRYAANAVRPAAICWSASYSFGGLDAQSSRGCEQALVMPVGVARWNACFSCCGRVDQRGTMRSRWKARRNDALMILRAFSESEVNERPSQ
jgi:hypothetical protein